eukprot:5769514-Amphidinium_carterae.1
MNPDDELERHSIALAFTIIGIEIHSYWHWHSSHWHWHSQLLALAFKSLALAFTVIGIGIQLLSLAFEALAFIVIVTGILGIGIQVHRLWHSQSEFWHSEPNDAITDKRSVQSGALSQTRLEGTSAQSTVCTESEWLKRLLRKSLQEG